MQEFNKNDKQQTFNQIKGKITELNDGEKFCNITLNVGHENVREVNLIIKKVNFDAITSTHKVGDKVSVAFYITSRKKNERWYTMANVLSVESAL